MKSIILTASMLLSSISSLAQNQVFDFKGLPLGSSTLELKKIFPEYHCRKSELGNTLSDSVCTLTPRIKCRVDIAQYSSFNSCFDAVQAAMTYAGVKSDISIMFYRDKVEMVYAKFNETSFSGVVSSLREKYGQPNSKKTEIVTNKMGVQFENDIYEWKGLGSNIKAEKYANQIDLSSVSIFTDTYFNEFEKRKSDSAKKGTSDL